MFICSGIGSDDLCWNRMSHVCPFSTPASSMSFDFIWLFSKHICTINEERNMPCEWILVRLYLFRSDFKIERYTKIKEKQYHDTQIIQYSQSSDESPSNGISCVYTNFGDHSDGAKKLLRLLNTLAICISFVYIKRDFDAVPFLTLHRCKNLFSRCDFSNRLQSWQTATVAATTIAAAPTDFSLVHALTVVILWCRLLVYYLSLWREKQSAILK